MKQHHFVGESSILNLSEIIQNYAPKSILLVRGKKSFESCGAKEAIIQSISSGIKLIEFYDFSENPKVEDLERGLKFLQENPCDLIIGIGGGSVLDMSKLIRFFHSYEGEMTGMEFVRFTTFLLPLIAIPTTAGTGSETTHFAVLYKNKVKYSVTHNDMQPDIAIVDPSFTYHSPKYLTACTGFDALAQGIEAYWNVNATENSDKYAMRAIKLLWSNLPIAVNTPTKKSRDKVSEGAYWAGRAINITKTTAPHALSYPFTTYYHYPHGHAVALTFPFFICYNFIEEEHFLSEKLVFSNFHKKMEYLYSVLDMKDKHDAYTKLNNYLLNIALMAELPTNYDPVKILENINIQRLKNNPRSLSNEDIQDLVFNRIFTLNNNNNDNR